MEHSGFSVYGWKTKCGHLAQICESRSLSPTHLYMILGQRIDEELDSVPMEYRDEAIAIASEFGYDPNNERAELQRWLVSRRLV